MEFFVGILVGTALTWWVFVTWRKPKCRLKFRTNCDWSGCDFSIGSSDYDTLEYVLCAHLQWHKAQLLDDKDN